MNQEQRDAAAAEGQRQHEASVAEGKERAALRAECEKIAQLAKRQDKELVADEILHTLLRP
jgi:hypothetical protein